MVSKCPKPSLGLRVHLSELGISEPPGRWSGPVVEWGEREGGFSTKQVEPPRWESVYLLKSGAPSKYQ